METLYFLKFWKPNTSSAMAVPSPVVETDSEFDEEEDSFFDLDIISEPEIKTHEESCKLEEKTEPKPKLSLSNSDTISKRKILPIEPILKPQSPIAILKSAPKLGVSIFKRPKSTSTSTKKTGETESYILTGAQKQETQEVKISDVIGASTPLSKLTRDNSSKRNGSSKSERQGTEDSSKTEKSSKDVIHKYLKLIKPLYLKVSKRHGEKARISGDFPVDSPTSSPATMYSQRKEKQGNIPAGIRVMCKHLGKSKSATTMALAQPVSRRDDSLLLQNDGIQGAILHCKRSFNSSRDSACFSRSTSWTSSMNSYSSDSSLLSRFAVECHERSARSSIEEEHHASDI